MPAEPQAAAATASKPERPDRFRIIYPFDVVLLLYALAAFVASQVYEFPIAWALLVDASLDVAILYSFAAYVAILGLIQYQRMRSAGLEIHEVKTRIVGAIKDWVTDWRSYYELFRLTFAFKMLMVIYTSLKVRIPHINPTNYDAAFRRIDEVMHFGVDLAVAVPQGFLSADWIAWIIDINYVAWYPVKIAIVAWFVFFAERKRCWRFFTCMALLWSICGAMAIIWPSLGPCYAYPELTADLNIVEAHKLQTGLWESYQWTLGHPGQFSSFEGIAAFPSLHVGMAALYVCFFTHNKKLTGLLGAFAFMTLLGSVYTGWHYAVDGYVSSLVAVGAYLGTAPFFKPKDPDEPPSAPPTSPDQSADPAPGSDPPTTR